MEGSSEIAVDNKKQNDDASLSSEPSISAGHTAVDQDKPEIKKKVKDYPRKQSRTNTSIQVSPTVPKRREECLRWYGWGYQDSGFEMNDGIALFFGKRYPISGSMLPYLNDYIKEKFDLEVTGTIKPGCLDPPKEEDYPDSRFSKETLDAIEELGIDVATDGILRLMRSQGQSFDDVWKVRAKKMLRIPDAVAWPKCHEEVVELIKLASEKGFAIIPFGGGTSVAGALECPTYEQRPILSVDTSLMNEILWVDRESLVVCAESGIVGQDLERELRKLGYTTGHEPDSIEFSTLGGWVATRASGMKKNTYGNIEDLVVHIRMVTPSGVLEKGTRAPRMSCGPDFNHIVLGSEGWLGLITEVALKIRPFPECQMYDSLVFADFQTGIKFMREVAKRRWQPASIRLLDHEQFQIGWAIRPKQTLFGSILEGIKFGYLEKIKRFDLKKICLTTIVLEGKKDEVLEHKKKLSKLAVEMNGIPAGSTTGQRGYMMTFVVAYVRDIALEFNVVSDSMESALPWDNVYPASVKVRDTITAECIRVGAMRSLSMMRVAQTYDAGACLYVYFVFRVHLGSDVLKMVEHIHFCIKNVILSYGGSVSHHHGVGKHKKYWYEKAVSTPGVNILKSAKNQLDPRNIFAAGNFVDDLTVSKSKL